MKDQFKKSLKPLKIPWKGLVFCGICLGGQGLMGSPKPKNMLKIIDSRNLQIQIHELGLLISFITHTFNVNMKKYQIIQNIAKTNFSGVYKAKNQVTSEIVIIKTLEHQRNTQQIQQIKFLRCLDHPNIIKPIQIFQSHLTSDTTVVYECLEDNLLQLYTSSKYAINQNQLKCILFQVALALEYIHSKGILHRDIKPENIVIDKRNALVKLIDFGSAKQQYHANTDYITTRWYRAPEALLGMRKITTAIDIFALGCVALELFALKPIFTGDNTIDQLNKIFNILGSPNPDSWKEGFIYLKKHQLEINQKLKIPLKNFFPTASRIFINLIEGMLELNYEKRMTAKQILNHQFFENIEGLIPQVSYNKAIEQACVKKIQTKQRSPLAMRITQNRKKAENSASPLKYLKKRSISYSRRHKLESAVVSPIKKQNSKVMKDLIDKNGKFTHLL